jgi:hypothetical protein
MKPHDFLFRACAPPRPGAKATSPNIKFRIGYRRRRLFELQSNHDQEAGLEEAQVLEGLYAMSNRAAEVYGGAPTVFVLREKWT